MRLVDAPEFAPGCCFVCRTTPKGPYIDTEIEDEDNDRYYLCMTCLNEALRLTLDDEGEIETQLVKKLRELDEALKAATPKKFVCKVCGKELDSQNALNGHTTGHKRKGEWPE